MAPSTSDRSQTDAVAQLITACRQKYALGAARLDAGDHALALLSLHGAVEDGLRAYLATQGQEGIESWRDIIERLRADRAKPLDDDTAAYLRRINALRNRVAHGEQGSIERAAVVEYQQLAARLLSAYDIALGKAAPQPAERKRAAPAKNVPSTQKKRPRAAKRASADGRLNPLIPIGAVVLVLAIGLLTTLAQNRSRTTIVNTAPQPSAAPNAPDTNAAPIAATLTAAPLAASPVPVSPTFVQLVAGAHAVVSAEGNQLSLRAQPGLQGALLASLAAGAEVLILDGPQEADGLRWWRVRAGATEGWCAEPYLVMQAGP